MQSRGHTFAPSYKILQEPEKNKLKRIREYTRTGRPGGADDFVSKLEGQTERTLRNGKPGPKSRLN